MKLTDGIGNNIKNTSVIKSDTAYAKISIKLSTHWLLRRLEADAHHAEK